MGKWEALVRGGISLMVPIYQTYNLLNGTVLPTGDFLLCILTSLLSGDECHQYNLTIPQIGRVTHWTVTMVRNDQDGLQETASGAIRGFCREGERGGARRLRCEQVHHLFDVNRLNLYDWWKIFSKIISYEYIHFKKHINFHILNYIFFTKKLAEPWLLVCQVPQA